MKRVEFMTELAALLQDVPAEERREAMQYYNDYLDDAGEENEEQAIEEFGSPKKVAEIIKADLAGMKEEQKEYSERGYTDRRFEYSEVPAGPEEEPKKKTSEMDPLLKIVLIGIIALIVIPIAVPLIAGAALSILGVACAILFTFLAFVIGFIAIAVVGVILLVAGVMNMVPELAAGLALFGTGLILTAVGVAGTVISIKLCTIVVPAGVKGIAWICRKCKEAFQRKAVVS